MKVDYLIVGQGIAGTLLCHQLEKRNVSFKVIDKGNKGSSSDIAAGIINPITGRKYVKTWMFDALEPIAKSNYLELEKKLNEKILYNPNVVRILFNKDNQRDWEKIFLNPSAERHVEMEPSLGKFEDLIHPPFDIGEFKGSMRVDVSLLIKAYRLYLEERDSIIEEDFDFDQLELNDGIHYKGIHASGIIFSCGHQDSKNPLFLNLPFKFAKGEVIRFKIDQELPNKMLKHKWFLVPYADGSFWSGGGYQWHFDDINPTQDFLDKWNADMSQILKVDYEVVSHQAAVRPCVNDRRPFMGTHHQYPNVHIFNGMGTKGTSLAPYWSEHFIGHILDKNPLDEIVNLNRFKKRKVAEE